MNKDELKTVLIEILQEFDESDLGKDLAYYGHFSLHNLLEFLSEKPTPNQPSDNK